jgi:Holliday junction resolvase
MTYAKRVDSNHSIIVKALRDLGCSVFDTSATGRGCPDILVGIYSKTALVEIKRDAKAPYTEAQKKFMQNWKGGPVCRIHDVEGAINLVKTLEKS